MRGSASLILALVALGACSRDWEQFDVVEVDAGGLGGAGGTGGTNVGGGTCFPGSKACPDPSGALMCMQSNNPSTSCGDTSCAPCNLKNASATCVSEKCAIQSCDPGWQDCNDSPIDGCESNTNSDGKNCGGCGKPCGAGYLCDGAGHCIVNTCEPSTTADCDGDKSSCEVDLENDPNNCGFCSNVCALAHAVAACSQGLCAVASCDAGWANCDGNDANGCETDVSTDTGNCGTCGNKCDATNGVPGCSAGNCGIICFAGFGNCDGYADNGCERSLKTDASHCGSCATPCPAVNASATCTNGICGFASCLSGFGSCDGIASNGCEINLLQNKNHCGACGQVCVAPAGGTASCASGACSFSCNAGLTKCGTQCVNTQTDNAHCGSCGAACTGAKTCVAGYCV